jgi:hypothetical protein
MIIYGRALSDGNAHQRHNLATVRSGRRSPTCSGPCSIGWACRSINSAAAMAV